MRQAEGGAAARQQRYGKPTPLASYCDGKAPLPCLCLLLPSSCEPNNHTNTHEPVPSPHLCRASTVTAASSSSAFLQTTLPMLSVSISYCICDRQYSGRRLNA